MIELVMNSQDFLEKATKEAVAEFEKGKRKFVGKLSEDAPVFPKDIIIVIDDNVPEGMALVGKKEGEG